MSGIDKTLLDYINSENWKGLAKAFAEANIEWHAEEWRMFVKQIETRVRRRERKLRKREIEEAHTPKEQVKRFKATLSRAWIPRDDAEKEIYDQVEHTLVPYVETLLKQTYRAGGNATPNQRDGE